MPIGHGVVESGCRAIGQSSARRVGRLFAPQITVSGSCWNGGVYPKDLSDDWPIVRQTEPRRSRNLARDERRRVIPGSVKVTG